MRIVTVDFDGSSCVMACPENHTFRAGARVIDFDGKVGTCTHDEFSLAAHTIDLLSGLGVSINKMDGYVIEAVYTDKALMGVNSYVYADALQAAAES